MTTVCLDGTPLLGRRTGIGRYTEHLVAELATRTDLDVSVTAFTLRGSGDLADTTPAGVTVRQRPVPARALRWAWSRGSLPPVRWLAGASEVFHGTNFWLPPPGKAAGVVTIHDLAFLTHPDTVDRTARQLVDLVPLSIRRSRCVLTPTHAMAQAIKDAYRVPDDQLVVTPLGVTDEWRRAAPATPDQLRDWGFPDRYLLFVGTREPRKGLSTLLAAHAVAEHADSATAPLVLVGGDGWGEQATPSSDVRLAGYTDQSRLPAIVAAADALVMPSVYEGFGIPAIEALATGTRTIVSDAAALLEVTGGHADTFPVGDVEQLAALLTPRTDDPLAASRRRGWASRWTWQACADTTVAAYQRAVS